MALSKTQLKLGTKIIAIIGMLLAALGVVSNVFMTISLSTTTSSVLFGRVLVGLATIPVDLAVHFFLAWILLRGSDLDDFNKCGIWFVGAVMALIDCVQTLVISVVTSKDLCKYNLAFTGIYIGYFLVSLGFVYFFLRELAVNSNGQEKTEFTGGSGTEIPLNSDVTVIPVDENVKIEAIIVKQL